MDMIGIGFIVLVTVHSALVLESSRNTKKKPSSPGRKVMTTAPIQHRPSSTADIINSVMKDYVKQEPPRPDHPTEVKLGIYVNSFYSISEQTMDYSVNMYFRQSWKDPRLMFNQNDLPKQKQIRLGQNRYSGKDGVWVPDTFFRNEKKAQYHSITVDNKMMKLSADGSVWYVTKISATLSCPMKLHKYPFDTQVCPMMFESFGYTMDVLYFSWLDPPVEVDASILLPQFKLKSKLLYDCSQNYTAGAFSCQEIKFVLRRDVGFFVIQVFVPSILIVILSWVSFWINIDGVPARVSIGLLTVLTTTTQSSGINAQLPKVSYIKAIDIWMIMCLLFVFAALLEYAFVNVAARNGVRIRTPIVRQATLQAVDGGCRIPPPPVSAEPERKMPAALSACWRAFSRTDLTRFTVTVDVEGSKRRARQIDKVSRKVFPVGFLLFNLLYWLALTIPTGISDTDEPES